MLPLPSFAEDSLSGASAGSAGEGRTSTSYWYGGSLHPLVVSRDGVDYRLIAKEVVERVEAGGRSYLLADRLGSVRVVTNDRGQVGQSLGYDDYGLTRIAGESSAAADAAVDSLSTYYAAQSGKIDVQMLDYRSSFLPAFDWTNGRIETEIGGVISTGVVAERDGFSTRRTPNMPSAM
jgi:hypothetical protein